MGIVHALASMLHVILLHTSMLDFDQLKHVVTLIQHMHVISILVSAAGVFDILWIVPLASAPPHKRRHRTLSDACPLSWQNF